jgi:glucoamylase
VKVTFNVNATTVPGENIYLVGSVDALQNWAPENALALNADNYPTWSVNVNVPIDTQVQYKYIRKTPPSTAVTWESDPNMALDVPVGGDVETHDVWR